MKRLTYDRVGRFGVGDVFTYCHAGGLNFETCNQQFSQTIEITSG